MKWYSAKTFYCRYGTTTLFDSRNLDVYITRLRDYLKEDMAVQILTLKGVGYRLVCH